MKITLAQLNYTTGDIDGNAAKIIAAIENAKAEGVELIVFAEQAISGSPAFDLLRKTTFLELCDEALESIAEHCEGITAIVGLPILTNEGAVSAAAVIANGQVEQFIGKKFITARREMGFLVPAKGYEYIEVAGHRLAVVIGDDLSCIRDMEREADMIISVNARRYGKDVLAYRYDTMRKMAFVEGKTLVFVNNVGGSGELVYDGTSCVVSPAGDIVMLLESFEEDIKTFDTENIPTPIETMPYSTCNDHTRMLYRAACLGLKDYFAKSGYTKASIGLSGGIDSAVVACIAAHTLGKENVKALLMPSPFTAESSVEDAKALAENLGIQYSVLPIREAYRSVMDTLKPITGGTDFDATEENMQSRIRTMMLMALQNKSGYVMLNSSNTYRKNACEYQKRVPMKGQPVIDQITQDIRNIINREMPQKRLGVRPMFNLIEHARARQQKRHHIGRNHRQKHFGAVNGKVGNGLRDAKIDDSGDDGTKATEKQTAVQKSFHIHIHRNPNLSLTLLSCRLDT